MGFFLLKGRRTNNRNMVTRSISFLQNSYQIDITHNRDLRIPYTLYISSDWSSQEKPKRDRSPSSDDSRQPNIDNEIKSSLFRRSTYHTLRFPLMIPHNDEMTKVFGFGVGTERWSDFWKSQNENRFSKCDALDVGQCE